jgi:hypothetical protein
MISTAFAISHSKSLRYLLVDRLMHPDPIVKIFLNIPIGIK